VTTLRYHFAMMKMLRVNSQRRRNAGDTLKQLSNHYGCKPYLVRQLHTTHRWLKRGLRQKRKPKIDRAHVAEFLSRDDNTRLTAGKKDTRTCKKDKQQIRYLHFSLDVLYDKYVAEHPDIDISIASFYRMKPFFILQPNMYSVEQCLCIHCTNMQLLCDVMYARKLIISRLPDIQVAKIVCAEPGRDCYARNCKNCKTNISYSLEAASVGFDVHYMLWNRKKDGKFVSTVLSEFHASSLDLAHLFHATLCVYAAHIFRVCHQYKEIRGVREKLTSEQCMLHVDFSENLTLKDAQQVQAAHFGNHEQVVLHQGVMYLHGQEPRGFLTLSSDDRKTAESVAAHLLPIVQEVKKCVPELKKLFIVSDSPTAQYRNRYMPELMRLLCAELAIEDFDWTYSEAGHGKGAPDGVGAAAKRCADAFVARGGALRRVQDVVEVLAAAGSSILVKQVQSADIDAMKIKLVDKPAPMKGISKAHHVFSTNQRIYYRELACHCSVGFCHCFRPKIWEPHPRVGEDNLASDDEDVEPVPAIPDIGILDPEEHGAGIIDTLHLDAGPLDPDVPNPGNLDDEFSVIPKPLREVLANRGFIVPPPDEQAKYNDYVLARYIPRSARKLQQPPLSPSQC
jgi:hypothetical protein